MALPVFIFNTLNVERESKGFVLIHSKAPISGLLLDRMKRGVKSTGICIDMIFGNVLQQIQAFSFHLTHFVIKVWHRAPEFAMPKSSFVNIEVQRPLKF